MSRRQCLWEGRRQEERGGRGKGGGGESAEGEVEPQCSHKEGFSRLFREFSPGNDLRSHLTWSWRRDRGGSLMPPCLSVLEPPWKGARLWRGGSPLWPRLIALYGLIALTAKVHLQAALPAAGGPKCLPP